MNDSSSTLVALNDVTLNLPSHGKDITILRSISCSIPKHKTVAITGASGSGKTSLLMLLAGLEQPSSGSITIQGEKLHTMDEETRTHFRNEHIGIVFQAFHLMPTMSALENVMLPLELSGKYDMQQMRDKARDMLALVGLEHRVDHRPSQLSGGEQQRVAIARACISTPAIILADEPTGNLDQATGEKIITMLFDMHAREGSTLLLVTHDIALAARCDMQIDMRDGEIIEIRTGVMSESGQ